MIDKFKACCVPTLPTVWEPGMSLWNILCRAIDRLNEIINETNKLEGEVEELIKLYKELKEYVDHYFDNLDVQEEINNKLSQMVKDGTLNFLINYAPNYKSNLIMQVPFLLDNFTAQGSCSDGQFIYSYFESTTSTDLNYISVIDINNKLEIKTIKCNFYHGNSLTYCEKDGCIYGACLKHDEQPITLIGKLDLNTEIVTYIDYGTNVSSISYYNDMFYIVTDIIILSKYNVIETDYEFNTIRTIEVTANIDAMYTPQNITANNGFLYTVYHNKSSMISITPILSSNQTAPIQYVELPKFINDYREMAELESLSFIGNRAFALGRTNSYNGDSRGDTYLNVVEVGLNVSVFPFSTGLIGSFIRELGYTGSYIINVDDTPTLQPFHFDSLNFICVADAVNYANSRRQGVTIHFNNIQNQTLKRYRIKSAVPMRFENMSCYHWYIYNNPSLVFYQCNFYGTVTNSCIEIFNTPVYFNQCSFNDPNEYGATLLMGADVKFTSCTNNTGGKLYLDGILGSAKLYDYADNNSESVSQSSSNSYKVILPSSTLTVGSTTNVIKNIGRTDNIFAGGLRQRITTLGNQQNVLHFSNGILYAVNITYTYNQNLKINSAINMVTGESVSSIPEFSLVTLPY